MITGNKGEWSEIYVFLKLLADGILHAADKNLKKIENIYYPILAILRWEGKKKLRYNRSQNVHVISGRGKTLAKISVKRFKVYAANLLRKIKEEEGAFSCPKTEKFLKKLHISKIKSASTQKEDITMVVHDLKTGITPKLSFSIKSRLGGASTLLNASKSTNFTYILTKESVRIADDQAEYEREKQGIKQRIQHKIEQGYSVKFSHLDSHVFASNLMMIDTLLPNILASILLTYYNGQGTTVKELTNFLVKNDPLDFKKNGRKFYEHKIKNFLLDVALGMTPATSWEGKYLATGGYIVVRETGDILCYHIYNTNEFRDYLFENTRLETPSTKRHNFGKIYRENGQEKIKLNLQIRFTR